MSNDFSVISNYSSAPFESGELAGMFALLAIIMIPLFILFLVMYIFQAIALMKIAENAGSDKGWLAWIPIANGFVMPMLVEDEVHEGMRGKFTLIYGLSLVGSIILSGFIPFVAIVPSVLAYYAFYIITKWYSESHVAHLVIAILSGGISIPFSLFRFRNRTINKSEFI